jgi:hypothetical protein
MGEMLYVVLGVSLLINGLVAYIIYLFLKEPKVEKPQVINKPKLNERDAAIDFLSRQKLVYCPEEKGYVVRRQIN